MRRKLHTRGPAPVHRAAAATRFPPGRRRCQQGQALVLTVASLTALMGFLTLGIDIGVVRYDQAKLQTVADAAALAGAAELPYGDVSAGATRAAAQNGFTSGVGGDTLVINDPPLSGPHSGQAGYVEVIASETQATVFARVFGIDSLTPSARAVGYLGNGKGCFYALDPSVGGAITANGSFQVTLKCAMYADSSSPQALLANGSGSISAASIGVVGGVLDNGVTLTPTPVDGIVPLADPLAYLNPPSTAGSCSSTTIINGSGNFTLQPGVYCSPLIINGSPNVTFGSGTYVLERGIIMNGTPTLTGSGVTFYNAGGGLTLNGSSSSNLSAPTTGPYAGILVFQARNNSSPLTINGTNQSVINGAIYAPDAHIIDNGSGAASAYSILVGDTVTVNGTATLNDDYTSLPGGSPIKAAVLVE